MRALLVCALFLSILSIIESRSLQHQISMDDISNMPVDAIWPMMKGDTNDVIKKYALSQVGISGSRTIGSYFGKKQTANPLARIFGSKKDDQPGGIRGFFNRALGRDNQNQNQNNPNAGRGRGNENGQNPGFMNRVRNFFRRNKGNQTNRGNHNDNNNNNNNNNMHKIKKNHPRRTNTNNTNNQQ